MMKKLIIFFCGTLALTACRNGIEKKANEKLAIARAAYEHGDYEEARTQIDSIGILYPEAFGARKTGQELMLDAGLEAQQEILASLDSALQAKQAASDATRGKYALGKDAEYQQVGNYVWPTQAIKKNLHRSFLRSRVSGQGIMSMASIYCGTGNIHHVGVKVMTPDDSSTEAPTSKNSYETSDVNGKIEKADYKLGKDGNVIEFLNPNRDENIRVEFIGDRRYTATMSPTDRQAVAGIYELSKILSAMQQIEKEQEDASLKIEFINKKKERKVMEEAAEE